MLFYYRKFDWRIEIEKVHVVIIFCEFIYVLKKPRFLSFVNHYLMFIGTHGDMAIRNNTLFQYISHESKNAML